MLSNKNEYSQNYRIALLSRGQMFGDQDVFFDRPYQTTVTCRSNDGELYQITKENFKKIKNLGDCWQKITSKYVTQEYLHHKLMKNQQKMKSESVSKRSKKRSKEEKSINSNVKGSPLLNKYEMDKRQTFKEIVNGFPFAHKQKKLIESIYTTNNKNIVTDKDIEMYQQSKIEQLREKASFMGKRETTFRALIDAQIQISNDKESKINSSVSFDNKQNISVNNENRKSVYISSRISRCIESMIDGEKVNDIYKSKSKFNINNSEQKLCESMEGSPESIGYRQTFINKNRSSFIEYSESKVKGINNFVPKSMNIREYQNTPATEHRSSQIATSFSYCNKHQYSFSGINKLKESVTRNSTTRDPKVMPIACTMRAQSQARKMRLSTTTSNGFRIRKNIVNSKPAKRSQNYEQNINISAKPTYRRTMIGQFDN